MEEFRNNVLLFYTGVTRSANDILAAQKSDTERNHAAVVDSLHRTGKAAIKSRRPWRRATSSISVACWTCTGRTKNAVRGK